MAYADANSTNRKLGASAAVLALEAVLAWAIIAGLTMTITTRKDPRVNTFTIPPETAVKPPEVPVTPTSQPQQRAPRPLTEPVVDLSPTTLPTFAANDGFGSGDAGTVEFPSATPTPSSVPSFAPKSARPKGNTANWVSTSAYPTSDLRGEHEGSVRYRLSIDAAGKVNTCTVVATSGFAGLDQAACAELMRHAKFDPATNETGVRAPGSFTGTVTWRLPQD